MRDAMTTAIRSLPGTGSISGGQSGLGQLPAAVAGLPSENTDERMDLLTHLAAVPVWHASVGGSTPHAGVRHIDGGARVTGSGAAMVAPLSARPTGATVALADGTRITFSAVYEVPVPEPA